LSKLDHVNWVTDDDEALRNVLTRLMSYLHYEFAPERKRLADYARGQDGLFWHDRLIDDARGYSGEAWLGGERDTFDEHVHQEQIKTDDLVEKCLLLIAQILNYRRRAEALSSEREREREAREEAA
jgi:hypothetical protein